MNMALSYKFLKLSVGLQCLYSRVPFPFSVNEINSIKFHSSLSLSRKMLQKIAALFLRDLLPQCKPQVMH